MTSEACGILVDHNGRELIEHGTTLFPIAFYQDDLRSSPISWHWHDEWEAGIVTEGSMVLAFGTEKYVLHKNQGFFINTNVLHGGWGAESAACCLQSLVFHSRLISGEVESVFWQRYARPLLENRNRTGIVFDHTQGWHREAIQAIETAWRSGVEGAPGYEFQVRDALSKLVLLLRNGCPESPPGQTSARAIRNGTRMKQMLHYIQEHYNEEITTAQIAQSAMISESECLRCFRSTIGTSPIRYTRQIRIEKAAELLKTTQLKISDIAMQSGFQDISYFTKAFREQQGCTPTEYRKKRLE